MSGARVKTWRVIPALDTSDLEAAGRLAAAVAEHPLVYGFKIGFALGLTHGLPAVVRRLKAAADRPVIYDHQKGGTDIPETGALFARTLAEAGVDEAILFPFTGPRTLAAWIEALAAAGRTVIVGGAMTHPGFVADEGGYLRPDGPEAIYRAALAAGARNFVVPLTRPALVRQLCAEAGLGPGHTFYSPGFGAQGGDPAAFDFIDRHYLIVGRALTGAADPRRFLDQLGARLDQVSPPT